VQPESPRTEDAIRLGPYRVRAERAEIAAFALALFASGAGAERSGGVPFTFPIRWLGLPAVREAIIRSAGGPGGFLVHESQSFDYARPVEADRDYALDIEVRRDPAPPHRIVVQAAVHDLAGTLIVKFDGVLRAVALDPPREESP
jgi:hypothetical protein